MTDNLPTARSTLPKASPMKDLRFRCAKCGSRRADAVMMGKGGIGVQPRRKSMA